ncbi:hypothetical protein HPB50_026389 [Hyalomma asiaticum]|uniref:Uncharacterized protein n=1 Tax=Hyalomma asiaticum TaxID=266040 RepID=A0ACB7RU48_HYAAI|nr:hypothetical protein HPB50_026389 [Hyalomma asiaticum]
MAKETGGDEEAMYKEREKRACRDFCVPESGLLDTYQTLQRVSSSSRVDIYDHFTFSHYTYTEVELVHLKALLDKKAALERGRILEIYELKNRLEEEEHRRKEAELRFAEMNIEAKNYRAATEDLLKELERCCSLKDALMEEMRPLGECSILSPNLLAEAKENLKKTLLKKKALKCKVSDLTAELEGCRKELDTKSPSFMGEVPVKCMEDPLYDVIFGNVKGVVLPDARSLNECGLQLDCGAWMKTEPTRVDWHPGKCDNEAPMAASDFAMRQGNRKSKQYQDTVGSMVALQEKLQELQQRVQDISAEYAECQDKTTFLEQEHASVLSHRDSLDQQLKDQQEEKALLEACLRKLAGSLCSHLDLENTPTLAVIQALGSALQQVLLENSSLRDK